MAIACGGVADTCNFWIANSAVYRTPPCTALENATPEQIIQNIQTTLGMSQQQIYTQKFLVKHKKYNKWHIHALCNEYGDGVKTYQLCLKAHLQVLTKLIL